MAIYHMNIKIGSRSKGQSAISASAYRAGAKLKDYETGLTSDYTRKHGVCFSEIVLCANASQEYMNRETLWNAVHKIEKNKNAQLWREFEVALPQELSRDEQIATVREFVKQLTDSGMCADWALHDKGDGNPHAHIMTTMRSIIEDGTWASKSRLVYDLDENGERIFQKINKQGRKQYKSHKEDYNNWNAQERVEEWRALWAECCNKRLSERDQIDHRSYARRGIDQVPTVHEGYTARKIVASGGTSPLVSLNNEIRQGNQILAQTAEILRQIDIEIKQLQEEIAKGRVENNGRITELLARRQRTLDNGISGLERGATDGKRAVQSGEQDTTGADTDVIIRQAETNINASKTNQSAFRAERTDTTAVIRQSETKVESSGTSRNDREIERERLRIEESRKIAEQLERERKALEERSRKKSRGGFER